MNELTCEDCRNQLDELMAGELSPADKQAIDDHLTTCPDCAASLSQLWALEAAATRWTEQRVPNWNRRAFFFAPRQWIAPVQWAGALASVMLVFVLAAQVRIDTEDGWTVSFGPAYMTEAEVMERMERMQSAQARVLADELDRIRQQQAAGDRLVLTSLLQTSRRERRDDLADLVSVLDESETRRDIRTRETLAYLISTQREDRKDIQQLHEALQLVGNQGDTL